jgi:hypothetical protein
MRTFRKERKRKSYSFRIQVWQMGSIEQLPTRITAQYIRSVAQILFYIHLSGHLSHPLVLSL